MCITNCLIHVLFELLTMVALCIVVANAFFWNVCKQLLLEYFLELSRKIFYNMFPNFHHTILKLVSNKLFQPDMLSLYRHP